MVLNTDKEIKEVSAQGMTDSRREWQNRDFVHPFNQIERDWDNKQVLCKYLGDPDSQDIEFKAVGKGKKRLNNEDRKLMQQPMKANQRQGKLNSLTYVAYL